MTKKRETAKKKKNDATERSQKRSLDIHTTKKISLLFMKFVVLSFLHELTEEDIDFDQYLLKLVHSLVEYCHVLRLLHCYLHDHHYFEIEALHHHRLTQDPSLSVQQVAVAVELTKKTECFRRFIKIDAYGK